MDLSWFDCSFSIHGNEPACLIKHSIFSCNVTLKLTSYILFFEDLYSNFELIMSCIFLDPYIDVLN